MKKEISKLKQDAQKYGQQILDFLTVINQNHQASERQTESFKTDQA